MTVTESVTQSQCSWYGAVDFFSVSSSSDKYISAMGCDPVGIIAMQHVEHNPKSFSFCLRVICGE